MELDRSHDPKREPGPINPQRYAFVPTYAGIATFFGVPLCLNQDDLRAGHVDVAVLGAPVDMGLGHRGAVYGPRALRGDERILVRGFGPGSGAASRTDGEVADPADVRR